jgi:transposase
MGKNQRIFSREFKLQVCKQLTEGTLSKTQAMRQHRLGAGTVERWMEQFEIRGEEAFDGNYWRAPQNAETKESLLKKEIEQLKLENQFLRDCLGKPPLSAGTK